MAAVACSGQGLWYFHLPRLHDHEALMRLSQFFLPTLKETPAEAHIVSHRLMLRAGMVRQLSAGIYSWLPLGYRVLKKNRTDCSRRAGCGWLQRVADADHPAGRVVAGKRAL
jgi:hypothetical protein